MSNDALWQTIFKLYDRDNSGLADEDEGVHPRLAKWERGERKKRKR